MQLSFPTQLGQLDILRERDQASQDGVIPKGVCSSYGLYDYHFKGKLSTMLQSINCLNGLGYT